MIISGQICGSKLQRVFTLGYGCWPPKSERDTRMAQKWPISGLFSHFLGPTWGGGCCFFGDSGVFGLCTRFAGFENNATLDKTEKHCRPQSRPKIGSKVTKNRILSLFRLFFVTCKMIENWGVCTGPASSQRRIATQNPLKLANHLLKGESTHIRSDFSPSGESVGLMLGAGDQRSQQP